MQDGSRRRDHDALRSVRSFFVFCLAVCLACLAGGLPLRAMGLVMVCVWFADFGFPVVSGLLLFGFAFVMLAVRCSRRCDDELCVSEFVTALKE